MAREIPRPDPATEAREIARLNARMDAIRRHSEQEANKVDFRKNTRQIMDEYRAKLKEVREDIRIPDKARYQLLNELAREYQTAFDEGRQAAKVAYYAEVDRLERLANPAPVRGQRSTAELLERQQLREDLQRQWPRAPHAILDEYREAVRKGDTMAVELYEQYAGGFIEDQGQRTEFADLTYENEKARMPAQQRVYLDQLENLVKEEPNLMMGMAHQAHLVAGDVKEARNAKPTRTREEVQIDQEIAARNAQLGQAAIDRRGGSDER